MLGRRGAGSAAEAVTMIHGLVGKDGRDVFLVADDCHPQTIEVVTARAEARGVTIGTQCGRIASCSPDSSATAGAAGR